MNQQAVQRPLHNLLWLILIPVLGMAAGVGVATLLNLDQDTYGNLLINLAFLVAVLSLLPASKLDRAGLGLKVRRETLRQHLVLGFIIFALYMLFYLFVIRISAFKPFTPNLAWGLVATAVVVVAEELYFRGLLFGTLEQRFSGRTALLVTAVLFGLFHTRQGVSGMVARFFTGWLWGSVRYASGMIFLLIFPIHYAYNAVWLLFVGNWADPPAWASVALPAAEFLLGLAIVLFHERRKDILAPAVQPNPGSIS